MKTKLITCLTGLIMATGISLTAQEADSTLTKRYETETIMLDYTNNTFVKNKEKKRTGFFGRKIEKEFEGKSLEAKTEFKDHKRKKKLAMGLLIVGGTAMVGGLVAAPVIIFPATAIMLLSGSGTYLSGGLLLNKSHRHLQKAVWLRNRDVIAKL